MWCSSSLAVSTDACCINAPMLLLLLMQSRLIIQSYIGRVIINIEAEKLSKMLRWHGATTHTPVAYDYRIGRIGPHRPASDGMMELQQTGVAKGKPGQ